MNRFDAFFQQALDRKAALGLRRALAVHVRETADPMRLRRDGAVLIDFSSNDYLGLASHPELAARSAAWAREYGTGARASRLVSGNLGVHQSVEAKLARFKGTEDALIFPSGWQANAAVIPAILAVSEAQTGHAALVFTDRLAHASMHHGCAAAGARQIRYRHNDLGHLEERLDAHRALPGLRFVITETVFSMDGDRADMDGLRALCDRFDAFLYVDEAHATGVLGPGGAGLAEGRADLVMGTFSKAMGAMGAYVAGSHALCAHLVNACSGFIYSTAPPPPMMGAIDAGLDLVPRLDAERARLSEHGALFRSMLEKAGMDTGASSTQIVPVTIGTADAARVAASRLAERGFLAVAIRPPTVPQGTARLRVALSAAHRTEDVAALAENVIAVLQGAGT